MDTNTTESSNFPQHVAIIMDGNGRWARGRGLARVAGHEAGAKAVKALIVHAAQLMIPYLTLFAFSQENWRRPRLEVRALMHLLAKALDQGVSFFSEHHLRLKVVGDLEALSKDMRKKIHHLQHITAEHQGMTLVLALNYSGRWDITQACQSLAAQVKQGALVPEQINESSMAAELVTHGLPDPDLLIRTSGELRISNFMLWQLSYAELYFSSKLWPDFTVSDFNDALESYANRQRRFGGLSENNQSMALTE